MLGGVALDIDLPEAFDADGAQAGGSGQGRVQSATSFTTSGSTNREAALTKSRRLRSARGMILGSGA